MKKIIILLGLTFILTGFKSNEVKELNPQNSSFKAINFYLKTLVITHSSVVRKPGIYGFSGVEVYKVTNNNRSLVTSFGNKSVYFFNTTEDKAFPGIKDIYYNLPKTPNYLREFRIPLADWNNTNIKYEVRFWHHLKGKILGSNLNFGKHSETLDLRELITIKKTKLLKVGKSYGNNVKTSNASNSLIEVEIY